MHLFTLVVIGLLCLAFRSTRNVGVIGLTLVSLAQPILFAVLLILGGIYQFYVKK